MMRSPLVRVGLVWAILFAVLTGCSNPSQASGGTASTAETTTTVDAGGVVPASTVVDRDVVISSGDTAALTAALNSAIAGDRIILQTGTYTSASQLTIAATNSGTEGHMKQLVAADGASVVLDFSSQPYGLTSAVSNPRGLQINGDYWVIKGIEVKGAADNGLYIGGSHNVVAFCTFHANRDSGLQLGRKDTTITDINQWPSCNLIYDCESYDNNDAAPNAGENADGFACKLTTGYGNVFRGCVSHNNIDDGWDLYTKTATGVIGPVTLDQCVAFGNGTLTDGTANPAGDKNGFKLGGSDMAVAHLVTRCVSFKNGKNGYTWNSNPGPMVLVNNTAWDNVEGNYKFDGPNGSEAVFFNDLSFWTSTSSVSDRAGNNSGKIIPNNCFWDKSKKALVGVPGVTTFSSADVVSTVTPAVFPLARNADGTYNLGNLAKLASTSPLVNHGVTPVYTSPTCCPVYDTPTWYNGVPDLGALEN